MFLVKKRILLAIAGTVWLAAGVNVARLGILSYQEIETVGILKILLSVSVFAVFGVMFYKMCGKHCKRIMNYEEERKPFWTFFDWKAYCIMTFMMGGGIWLRSSGLAPEAFIAVFYTGLGLALSLAGVLFWQKFITTKKVELIDP